MPKFYVNDQEYETPKPTLYGIDIKHLIREHWPQQLVLEESGQTPDRIIADADAVDLSAEVRRFYLIPSEIIGG